MVDGRFWKAQLRDVIRDRRWVLAWDNLAASRSRVAELKELGAEKLFVVAGHRGLGEGPAPEDAEHVVLGSAGKTMMEQIRSAEAGFANPGDAVSARLDAWDPERRARVIPTIFAAGESLCGRSYWGGRPASWRALEDKVLAESIWDAAGVDRAPAEVVDATPEALTAAARRLDQGQGTVWAGDAREGFNGGAEYVRWVRVPEGGGPVAAFFGEHCDRVRVMPFLDGLPCSIHGMVFDDAVIALRPCEMVVLRSLVSTRFRYASAASFWEPRPEDTDAMREVARRVGAHLRDRVDFRGAFTVDGVMTADGFRPTELNPRVGAALIILARGVPDLPLELLNLALVAGEVIDWRPEQLERLILRGSRVNRAGAASVHVPAAVSGERSAALFVGPGGMRRAREGDPEDVQLALGENPAGGFLKVTLHPDLTSVGPSVAPRVAAALAWADAEWELGIGPVSPAPDLRPSSLPTT